MVEKLQELRSIRVQKMKKQGEIFLFTYFFFSKKAGELRLIILRRRSLPISLFTLSVYTCNIFQPSNHKL